MMADNVYKNGFNAELMGKTITAVQAYTSLGIAYPPSARTPIQQQNRQNTELIQIIKLNFDSYLSHALKKGFKFLYLFYSNVHK